MRGFRLFAMTVLGLPALAFVGFGVFSAFRGAWLTVAVALAIAVFWGAAMLTWAVLPSSTPYATSDESGTLVRPDRRIDRLMLACILGGILGLGGLGVFGSLGWLRLPIPPNVEGAWMFFAPWAAVALVGLATLFVTLRRGGISCARLTPRGFEFAEHFRTRRGEWSNVVAVSNEAPDVPKATSPLVVTMADGSSVMLMESALLGPRDGLYHLIDFVWRNPDARAELTDGRAVARLLAS